MRSSYAIVALLVFAPAAAAAQTPTWHVDVGGTAMGEAWNFNETKESLVGINLGVDYVVWKAMTVRAEGSVLEVKQPGGDAWFRGATIGTRSRWDDTRVRPFVDFAVGASHATRPVPVRGTRFNYLILAGAGIGIPIREGLSVDLGARWLHISNNGRAGRQRNPDIQALGAVVAIGWSY